MFIMFSESALKNVKTMKQHCSALITCGTSTREFLFLCCRNWFFSCSRLAILTARLAKVVFLSMNKLALTLTVSLSSESHESLLVQRLLYSTKFSLSLTVDLLSVLTFHVMRACPSYLQLFFLQRFFCAPKLTLSFLF